MKRIAAIMTCSLALTGCDAFTQMGQMIGVVGTDWRPSVTSGVITGRVVDRNGNPLVGAKVTNGAAVYYSVSVAVANKTVTVSSSSTTVGTSSVTLDGEGQFVLSDIPSPYTFVTAEYDGKVSSPIQVPVKVGALNAAGDIKIPVDGPVADTASQSLRLIGTQTPGNLVTMSMATGSTTPAYRPSDTVSMILQAPPGSLGATIKSYRITYFAVGENTGGSNYLTTTDVGAGNPGAPIPLAYSATVLPGTAIRSGDQAQADAVISSTTAAFLNYIKLKGAIVAKIELLDAANATIKDRDGNAISTTVKIQYQP